MATDETEAPAGTLAGAVVDLLFGLAADREAAVRAAAGVIAPGRHRDRIAAALLRVDAARAELARAVADPTRSQPALIRWAKFVAVAVADAETAAWESLYQLAREGAAFKREETAA